MAINVSNPVTFVEALASAGQTVFSGTLDFYANSDVLVYKVDVGTTADDSTDLETESVDYTLTGAGTGSYTLTFLTALTLNDEVTIQVKQDGSRTTSFTTSGTLNSDDINQEYDLPDIGYKGVQDFITNRVLSFNTSDQLTGFDITIPDTRAANEVLAINAAGDGLTWSDVSAAAGAGAPAAATYILQDANVSLPNAQALDDLSDGFLRHIGGVVDVSASTNLKFANTFGIIDTNTNQMMTFATTASAVNEFTVTNAATGNPPILSATGNNTNIDLKLLPKGTGAVTVTGTTTYESNVTDDDDIPNKKYVDDQIATTNTISSATPTLNFKDTDSTDTDNNAQIFAQATATGSGAEDIDFTINSQRSGTATNWLFQDASAAEVKILNSIFTLSKTGNVQIDMIDEDGADNDVSFRLLHNLTNTSSGTENARVSFQGITAGTLSTFMQYDGATAGTEVLLLSISGEVALFSNQTFNATGTYAGFRNATVLAAGPHGSNIEAFNFWQVTESSTYSAELVGHYFRTVQSSTTVGQAGTGMKVEFDFDDNAAATYTSDNIALLGRAISTSPNSSHVINEFIGTQGDVTLNSGGDVLNAYGVRGLVLSENASGDIDNIAYGVYGGVENNSTATIPTGYGVFGAAKDNSGGGTFTTYFAGYFDDDTRTTGVFSIENAAPTFQFLDSDQTDADVSADISVNATDTGSGSEDVDVSFKSKIAGTLTEYLNFNADGDITVTPPVDLAVTEDIDLSSGKAYKIAGTEVLNATTLGSAVVASSLTSVGTLTSLSVTQATPGTVFTTFKTTATNDDPTQEFRQNRLATTDATVTTIETIAIPTTTTVMMKGFIVARRTGGGSGTAEDGASYEFASTYKNVAGTATIIGATELVVAEDQAGWTITFVVSSADILIRVTGAASNNISWHSHVYTYAISS